MKNYTHTGIKIILSSTDAQGRQKDEEREGECTSFHRRIVFSFRPPLKGPITSHLRPIRVNKIKKKKKKTAHKHRSLECSVFNVRFQQKGASPFVYVSPQLSHQKQN